MRVFCLPAVLRGLGEGVTPWSGARASEDGHARQPIRRAGASRSRGCGTTCTADAADATRPDRTRHARPASDATPGSGRPPSPAARTARTTDVRTGSGAGCSATVARTRSSPVSPVVRSPHAREWHSDHHGQSARGPRAPSTGAGFSGHWAPPRHRVTGPTGAVGFAQGQGYVHPHASGTQRRLQRYYLHTGMVRRETPNLSKFLPPGAMASEDDKTRRSTVQSVKLAGPGLYRNGS